MKTDKIQSILDFWYSAPMNQHWFNSTPEIDQEIKTRFEKLWQEAANGALDGWKNTATGCVALAIVLDQYPLNMFVVKLKVFRPNNKLSA